MGCIPAFSRKFRRDVRIIDAIWKDSSCHAFIVPAMCRRFAELLSKTVTRKARYREFERIAD